MASSPPRREERAPRWRALATPLRLGVALALLAILLSRVGWPDLVAAFASLAWWWIPVLLGIRIVALFVQSQRWRLFLADQRIRAASGRLFKSYWIARFFNNFLPGQFGGDAYRVLYGLEPGVNRAQVASSVVVERIAGMIGLAAVAAVGGWASFRLIEAAGLGFLPLAAFAMAGVLLIVALRPTLAIWLARTARVLPLARFNQLLARLASALLAHVGRRATLAGGILLSALFYLILGCESFLALHALGVEIDLGSVLVVAPTIALIVSLPISINGWGTAEAASVLLYTQLGVGEADALSMALLTRLNFLLMGGMGGLVYLGRSWYAPARADHPA